MTGWGQDGPLAPRAGHDINYIALAGVLHAIGRKGEAPVPPLNLVGDFGGGGMLLGFGVACALLEAQRSGQGQVVDAAMVEGASLLAAMFAGFLARRHAGARTRGANILDTGAPWYNVYETKDGKYVSIGSIETRFYEELLQRLELAERPRRSTTARAGRRCARPFAKTFKSKTRDEWCKVFEGSDACFAPVLSLVRGAARSAQCRAQRLHQRQARRAAGAGAALLAHARRGAARAARARRRAARRRSPTGVSPTSR